MDIQATNWQYGNTQLWPTSLSCTDTRPGSCVCQCRLMGRQWHPLEQMKPWGYGNVSNTNRRQRRVQKAARRPQTVSSWMQWIYDENYQGMISIFSRKSTDRQLKCILNFMVKFKMHFYTIFSISCILNCHISQIGVFYTMVFIWRENIHRTDHLLLKRYTVIWNSPWFYSTWNKYRNYDHAIILKRENFFTFQNIGVSIMKTKNHPTSHLSFTSYI